MAIRIHSVRCCCGKWYLFNYKDEHIDFHFSLTASPVRDICCKWRLNGERPSPLGSLQTWPLGCGASESIKLHARGSHTPDLAYGDTAGFAFSMRVFQHSQQAARSYTHHSLSSSSPLPARIAKSAGHDDVESRFSQVVVKRSLTTGVRPVRQESVVDRSNSHLIA